MNRYELRYKPAPQPGKVWVRAVISVGGSGQSYRIDRRMRRTWTLPRLRVLLAKGIGLRGFGLSRADQLDEQGDLQLSRMVGPVELVVIPTKTEREMEHEDDAEGNDSGHDAAGRGRARRGRAAA